jgi:hypothetical protein
MKRFILIFAVLIVAIGLQAQDYSGRIDIGESYKYLRTSKKLTNADTAIVVFNTRIHYPFTFSAGMNLDTLGTNTTTTDTLFVLGRIDDREPWVKIASSVWGGKTNTNVIVTHETAVRYRQIQLFYKGSGTAIRRIDDAWLKIWYE